MSSKVKLKTCKSNCYQKKVSITFFSKLLSIFAGLSVLSLAQARPGSALASRDTPNSLWCGYVKNAAVKQVSAVWTVPDVSLPSPNSQGDYEIFQWVGIDGASPSSCGNVLLQGGPSQVVRDSVSQTRTSVLLSRLRLDNEY